MKEKLIKILQKKIYLVLILAAPLLVFNVVHAADVSGAILKSTITTQSTSGSDQFDRSMNFPMSTDALTSLGLLNSNFRNQQLCVEGEACPVPDEVRSTPLGFDSPINDQMTITQSSRYNGYYNYYSKCVMESGGSYTRTDCGGPAAVDLFYNTGGNVSTGDEFWIPQEKTAYNALTITIDTPWSQGGGGTLNCQWYFVPSGGTSSYTALTNVVDPSACFTVSGTHTITWDMPNEVYGWSYPSWAGGPGQSGYWFGFEITAAGTGASIRPTGKNVSVAKQEWGAYPPTVATAGTNYDLYVGGPDMKTKSEFMTSVQGNSVTIDSFSSWYNSPFFTMWGVYLGGNSIEFEAYFDVTKVGGYAVEVLDVGNLICYSNFAHFGCMDPSGTRSGWGQNYNCPYGATMGSGFGHFQVPGTMTEGWHTIKFVRAIGNTSGVDNYCELFVDGVSYGGKQPPNYNYPYALGNPNSYEHKFGGNLNIEGIRKIHYNDCWYDAPHNIPSGNGWCSNKNSYPQYQYEFDFTDGWDDPTFILEVDDAGYGGQTYYANLYPLQQDRSYYYGNPSFNTQATASTGAFSPISAGGGPGSASTTLPAVDVITDLAPGGTFAGTTTVGTNLPGGAFLAEMAAQQNVPVSFFWAIIAAGITIAVLALVMKYLRNILVAALMGGIVLAGFTVPAVGIFPIWVLFFYTIIAGAVVIIGNRWGISV